jgi:hypothetical protein
MRLCNHRPVSTTEHLDDGVPESEGSDVEEVYAFLRADHAKERNGRERRRDLASARSMPGRYRWRRCGTPLMEIVVE